MGLYGDAIKNYKVIIKNSEKVQDFLHLNALNKIGLALIKINNYEDSLSYFEQVYEINPSYPNIEQNLKISKSLIENNGLIMDKDITLSLPGWIKSNAGWWLTDQTTDEVIFEALEYLQNKKLIGNYEFSNFSEQHVPIWIKEIVTWWVDEKISDDDFLKTIDYLSQQGIIII